MPTEKTNLKGIKSWAEEDRPREKLLLKGPSALSDAELLTILIGSGTKEKSALEIAKELLASADNDLTKLGTLSIAKIQKIKGLKKARSIAIVAALELGRRRKNETISKNPKIKTSKEAYNFVYSVFADKTHEEFYVLLLKQNQEVIKLQEISKGGLSGTVVDPKTIFNHALENHAANIILYHNHPSGNCSPSDSDTALTKKIKNASEFLDIRLLDHIIFAGNKYFSFADEGLL